LFRQHQLAVGHLGKALLDCRLQLVKIFGAQHHQVHLVGAVILLVKVEQIVSHRPVLAVIQGGQVANRKLRKRMLGVGQFTQHIPLAARIILQFQTVFRLHRVAFAVDILRVKQRGDKKARKAVEGRHQVRGVDIEEIVGFLEAGVGIVHAAMFADKGLVLAGLGVLVSAQEQHVLEEVGQAFALRRIVKAADIDAEGGGGLVGIGIGNQQGAKTVAEHHIAILAIIVGAFVDRFIALFVFRARHKPVGGCALLCAERGFGSGPCAVVIRRAGNKREQ